MMRKIFTGWGKIIPVFWVFLLLTVLPFSAAGQQESGMMVKPSLTQSEKGLSIAYEIRNMSAGKVSHAAVTTFLAAQTDRGDSLGDLPPGALVRYGCDFDTKDMLPGVYVAATRLDFGDQNGQQRRAYYFFSAAVKAQDMKKDANPLSATVKSPHVNRKSLWQSQGSFELILQNNLRQSLEPVVVFFLPDGLSVDQPERVYSLQAGEVQKIKIPLHIDPLAGRENNYWALAWHETNGVHYSRLIKGTVFVAEEPVYFKVFLLACAAAALALVILYFVRRRRKSTGA